MAWVKFLTVWWWQPLFLSVKKMKVGRGASLVDGLLGDSMSLSFPLPQGSTVTDSKKSTRAQTAVEMKLEACIYSFREGFPLVATDRSLPLKACKSFSPRENPPPPVLSQPRSSWQLPDEWRIAGWWSWLCISRTKFGRQQPSLEKRNLQPGKVNVSGYHWHSFLASLCNNMDYPTSSRCV